MLSSAPQVRDRVLRRYRLGLATKAPIGAGSFTAGSIMLVGEQTSHPEANKYHAPFCSTKACSGWLNALLEEANVPEESLFWVNALDNDGTEVDLGKLASAIEPKVIFALGNIARDQLKKHKLECIHVPHPQYWKRFKNKEPYPLIAQLYVHTAKPI
jgi:hypothetical protein